MAEAKKKRLSDLRLIDFVTTDIDGIDDAQVLQGPPGVDGYTPKIQILPKDYGYQLNVLSSEYGSWQTVDLSNGLSGKNGTDGEPGNDGEQGYTPVMTVNSDNLKWTMNVTYQKRNSAPSNFTASWEKGVNGRDGYTPILSASPAIHEGDISKISVNYEYKMKEQIPSSGTFILSTQSTGIGLDISAVMEYFGKVSLLKPTNEDGRPIHLSAQFYTDETLSEKISNLPDFVTTNNSAKTVTYAFVGGNSEQTEWARLDTSRFANGLGPELDNYPIIIDLNSYIKNENLDIDAVLGSKKRIVMKYAWFWQNDEFDTRYSDEYSLVFPSTSEVGATSSARTASVSKKLNTIEGEDPDFDMYAAAPNMPNVIVPELSGEVDIVLADYSAENTYTIKFSTLASTTLTFYIGNIDKTHREYQKVNAEMENAMKTYLNKRSNFTFDAGKEYLITIELDMITRLIAN